jgi:hypothetical protein
MIDFESPVCFERWDMSEDIERGRSLETTQQLALLVRNKSGNVVINMVDG